jgi:heparin binding hemagglutinin HbhA
MNMPTLPSAEDVRKAREQARKPLLAVLGAGDLAVKAVADVLQKARERMTSRTEAAKSTVTDLPDKLDPAELRKTVTNQYRSWAEHGEATLRKLRSQPQVKKAIDQVENVREKALHQVEMTTDRALSAVGDARDLADDVLGKVARQTRSVGEKTAISTEKVTEKATETVAEAGAEAASATRSVTRKAAATASAAKTGSGTAPRRTTNTRK